MKPTNALSHANTHMHTVKLCFMFKTGSHYVTVAGFELVVMCEAPPVLVLQTFTITPCRQLSVIYP